VFQALSKLPFQICGRCIGGYLLVVVAVTMIIITPTSFSSTSSVCPATISGRSAAYSFQVVSPERQLAITLSLKEEDGRDMLHALNEVLTDDEAADRQVHIYFSTLGLCIERNGDLFFFLAFATLS